MADWTAADIPDQQDRIVLVTGASSGLGLRSAEALVARGARVVLGCRNPVKADAALAQVRSLASGPEPELLAIDLASLASVRAAAAEAGERFDHVDVLMNNAGIMAVPKA